MLNKTFAIIAILIIGIYSTITAAGQKSDPVSGEWQVVFSIAGQTAEGTLKLKLDGDKVTGTIESAHTGPGTVSKGKFVDGKLSFTADFTDHESINITGTVKDGKLSGEFATEGMTGTWEAKK